MHLRISSATRRRLDVRPIRALCALCALCVLAQSILVGGPAMAHPADEGRQEVAFSIRDGHLVWSHDLWLGPLIGMPLWSREIDLNQDQAASLDEQTALGRNFTSAVALKIDGEPISISLASVDVAPYAKFLAQPASPQVRFVFTAPIASGQHVIEYRSQFDPERIKLVSRFPSGGGVAVRNPRVNGDTFDADVVIKPIALTVSASTTGEISHTAPNVASRVQLRNALFVLILLSMAAAVGLGVWLFSRWRASRGSIRP